MKIAIFCSASNALDEEYYALAKNLAYELANRKHEVITGGANVGIMKVLSETARELGVRTIGIIPKVIFHKELADHKNDELIITDTLSERKNKIIASADAFIALPGGFGTLDELMEVIVYKQLAILDKPIVIFNFKGFYDNLIRQFDVFFKNNFAKRKYSKLFLITDNFSDAFAYIENYQKQKSIDFEWFKVDKNNF